MRDRWPLARRRRATSGWLSRLGSSQRRPPSHRRGGPPATPLISGLSERTLTRVDESQIEAHASRASKPERRRQARSSVRSASGERRGREARRDLVARYATRVAVDRSRGFPTPRPACLPVMLGVIALDVAPSAASAARDRNKRPPSVRELSVLAPRLGLSTRRARPAPRGRDLRRIGFTDWFVGLPNRRGQDRLRRRTCARRRGSEPGCMPQRDRFEASRVSRHPYAVAIDTDNGAVLVPTGDRHHPESSTHLLYSVRESDWKSSAARCVFAGPTTGSK